MNKNITLFKISIPHLLPYTETIRQHSVKWRSTWKPCKFDLRATWTYIHTGQSRSLQSANINNIQLHLTLELLDLQCLIFQMNVHFEYHKSKWQSFLYNAWNDHKAPIRIHGKWWTWILKYKMKFILQLVI